MPQRYLHHETGEFDYSGNFAIVVTKDANGFLRPHAVFDTPAEAQTEANFVALNWDLPAFVREIRQDKGYAQVFDYMGGPHLPPKEANLNTLQTNKKDRTLKGLRRLQPVKHETLAHYLDYLHVRAQNNITGSKKPLNEKGLPDLSTPKQVYLVFDSPKEIDEEGRQNPHVIVTENCDVAPKPFTVGYNKEELQKIFDRSVAQIRYADGGYTRSSFCAQLGEAVFTTDGPQADNIHTAIGAKILNLLIAENFGAQGKVFHPHLTAGYFPIQALKYIENLYPHGHPERAQVFHRLQQYLTIRPPSKYTKASENDYHNRELINAIARGKNPDETILGLRYSGSQFFAATNPLLKAAAKNVQRPVDDAGTNLALILTEQISRSLISEPDLLKKDPQLVNRFVPLIEQISKIKVRKIAQLAEEFTTAFWARITMNNRHGPDRAELLKYLHENLSWYLTQLEAQAKKPVKARTAEILNEHLHDELIANTHLLHNQAGGLRLHKNTPWEKFERHHRDRRHAEQQEILDQEFTNCAEPHRLFPDETLLQYPPSQIVRVKKEPYAVVIERMVTPQMCFQEHKIMGHCVDTYISSAEEGSCALYRTYKVPTALLDENSQALQAIIPLLNFDDPKALINALPSIIEKGPFLPLEEKDLKTLTHQQREFILRLNQCRDPENVREALSNAGTPKNIIEEASGDIVSLQEALNETGIPSETFQKVFHGNNDHIEDALNKRDAKKGSFVQSTIDSWRGTAELREGEIKQFRGVKNESKTPAQLNLIKRALTKNQDKEIRLKIKPEKTPATPAWMAKQSIGFVLVREKDLIKLKNQKADIITAIRELNPVQLGSRALPTCVTRGIRGKTTYVSAKKNLDWRVTALRTQIPGHVLIEIGIPTKPLIEDLVEKLNTEKAAKIAATLKAKLSHQNLNLVHIRASSPFNPNGITFRIPLEDFLKRKAEPLKQIGEPDTWNKLQDEHTSKNLRQTRNKTQILARELFTDWQNRTIKNAIAQGEKFIDLKGWLELPTDEQNAWLKRAQQFPALAEYQLEQAIAARFRHETPTLAPQILKWAPGFPQLDSVLDEYHQVEKAYAALEHEKERTRELTPSR